MEFKLIHSFHCQLICLFFYEIIVLSTKFQKIFLKCEFAEPKDAFKWMVLSIQESKDQRYSIYNNTKQK